jgi:hypothetical protein
MAYKGSSRDGRAPKRQPEKRILHEVMVDTPNPRPENSRQQEFSGSVIDPTSKGKRNKTAEACTK